MRNLLLLLVLANVLYFVWGIFSDNGQEPGVAVVEESDLGPPLEVAMDRGTEAAASVGAVLGSGEPSALAAVVGRSCVTIGPFRVASDADATQMQYAGEGMRARTRSTEGQIFVGHWVMVRNIADDLASSEMLEVLGNNGFQEAYSFRSDDTGLSISIGLFGELEGAEKTELEVKSLGLPAEIVARTKPGMVIYVDIALPPGKGAGAIVDKYGEDKVLLRDAATCPQSR